MSTANAKAAKREINAALKVWARKRCDNGDRPEGCFHGCQCQPGPKGFDSPEPPKRERVWTAKYFDRWQARPYAVPKHPNTGGTRCIRWIRVGGLFSCPCLTCARNRRAYAFTS